MTFERILIAASPPAWWSWRGRRIGRGFGDRTARRPA